MSRARILTIDDEAPIQLLLNAALQGDYEVVQAPSAEEGLRILDSGGIDLVLLDLGMPGLGGKGFLEAVKGRNGMMPPVIVQSGISDLHSVVECMRLGAQDFITKPINLDELAVTLENTLRLRRLQNEVSQLQEELDRSSGLERLIGESESMEGVRQLVKKVSAHDISALITGDSGTGKELIARAIHDLSARRGGPFVTVDCGALPEGLVESEIFGHERGAFTGAVERRAGRLEAANGGTLFLDEVGNLPLLAQAKLLRALQERQVQRLGARQPVSVDVRVVAATNSNLKEAIAKGHFREDLYFRLCEVEIRLPSLRDRGEQDVLLLAHYFLRRFNAQFGRKVEDFDDEAIHRLRAYSWPGNVRELQSAVKRAVILCGDRIEAKDLSLSGPLRETPFSQPLENGLSLKEAVAHSVEKIERDMILRALAAAGNNKAQAARELKVDYKTLYNKMKELKLE